ncbi:MAG: NifB/NifX family molybdenum-iron cluster-binding protein [Firmicutes bacterium]|nr:NifB/NifX family molybdenum-iron cluster-binding protein [Bacillota bacterium]
MRIAVAVTERTAKAPVCEHLEEAKYLFIVETDSNEVLKVLSCGEEQADLMCAKATLDENCEAIICGDMDLPAFNLLADHMITRYYGWGANASQAIRMMLDNRLQLIRESRSGGHCEGVDHWADLQRTMEALEKK